MYWYCTKSTFRNDLIILEMSKLCGQSMYQKVWLILVWFINYYLVWQEPLNSFSKLHACIGSTEEMHSEVVWLHWKNENSVANKIHDFLTVTWCLFLKTQIVTVQFSIVIKIIFKLYECCNCRHTGKVGPGTLRWDSGPMTLRWDPKVYDKIKV